MKPRKEVSKLIEEYLNKEIAPEDEAILFELIQENSFVKEEFFLRQKIDRAIKKKDILELRDQLKELLERDSDESILREPIRLYKSKLFIAAASISVLIGFGIIAYFLIGEKSKKKQLTSVETENLHNTEFKVRTNTNSIDFKDNQENIIMEVSIPETQIRSLSDANKHSSQDLATLSEYKESDYFESFIDNFRSPEIRIIQPTASASFGSGSDIMFIWNYHPAEDSLFLSIFDNQEKLLQSTKVASEYILRLDLEPGIYYWKLESEDDLIFMNKFYIK